MLELEIIVSKRFFFVDFQNSFPKYIVLMHAISDLEDLGNVLRRFVKARAEVCKVSFERNFKNKETCILKLLIIFPVYSNSSH